MKFRKLVSLAAIAALASAALITATPAVAATGDTLLAGQQLTANQSLVSSDGRYIAKFQSDGNFVMYSPGNHAGWNTGPTSANRIILQADGNLVSYTAANAPAWQSATQHSRSDRLVMQSDGNLVLYSNANIPLWSNGSKMQGGDTLLSGQQLSGGGTISSPNGAYYAIQQPDGNLVVYSDAGVAQWYTGQSDALVLVMQTDGNLVQYGPNNSVTWNAGTNTGTANYLRVQDDGNLVVYSPTGSALWSSRTGRLGGGGALVDDYPAKWRNVAQDSVLDTWREYNRECTSFVAWRLHARAGFEMPFNDNANNWGTDASARGYAVNSTPTIGSIAWDSGSTTNPHGHVAWVAAVGAGTVTLEDYNYGSPKGTYHTHTASTGAYRYIHFAG